MGIYIIFRNFNIDMNLPVAILAVLFVEWVLLSVNRTDIQVGCFFVLDKVLSVHSE